MFYKLITQGYGSKVLNLIMDMYSKTKSVVKWKGKLSAEFVDEMGVAQGGILSPYLFKKFLGDLACNLSKQWGVVVDELTVLTHLLWADDLVLVSDSDYGLQCQLDNLFDYCSKWQMIINNLKTKVLVYNSGVTVMPNFNVGGVPIEIATQYNYLGNLYSTIDQSRVIKNYVLNNCRRALFKIRKLCLPLGQVPPSLGLKLFDSLVMPLVDYASEVWFNEEIAQGLEVFQLGYLKRLLGVRPQTPTLAVYGELGRHPLKYRLEMNKLKYLHRVNNLPDTSITKIVYKKLELLSEFGADSWFTDAMNLFSEFEKSCNINLDVFCKKNKESVKTMLKNYETKRFTTKWINDMDAITDDKKLRTYIKFKDELLFEDYLLLTVPKVRIAISRFCCSSHNLAIELGRHAKPKKIELAKRLCKKCNVIEDEMHHVTACTLNSKQRESLYSEVLKYEPNFISYSNAKKFKFILQTRERKLLQAFGMFLYKSYPVS